MLFARLSGSDDPLSLALDDARTLAARQVLDISPVGLLGALAPVAGAHAIELPEILCAGLPGDRPRPRQAAKELASGLRVVGSPERKLSISMIAPPAPPEWFQFFIAGDQAALGYLAADGYAVGPAFSTALLRRALRDKFAWRNPPPPVAIEPAVLVVLSTLFRGSANQVVDRARAELAPGATPAVKAAIDELRAAGIVEEQRGRLQPAPGFREVLASICSGHLTAIDFVAFVHDPPQPADRRRLLFVGPTGKRFLAQDVEGVGAATIFAALDAPAMTELARVLAP